MSVLYAILLGIIQGITEFLPVGSFGHLTLLESLLGLKRAPGVLFETMLHVGTLAAVATVFRKDIRQILEEAIGMAMEIVGNIYLFIHNKRTGENLPYTKILNTTYRKFTVLILVSTIPTAILGYTARRLVVKSAVSPLIYGIGVLITGIVLLVVDFGKSGGTKAARNAGCGDAMWIGICQGISVFPGLSRSGLTISAALLCGFSRNFAVKYSYLISIPAILGAMIMQAGGFASPSMSLGIGAHCILGMLAAGVTGYFAVRFLLRLTLKVKLRYFAYYCFAAGFFALAANYLF